MPRLVRSPAGWTVVGVVVAAVCVWAQAPQGPAPSTPTFRSDTTLVPLDVRVLDREGRPVTDLRQSEFTIIEDGVRQEVRHFSLQALTPQAPSTEPLRRRAVRATEIEPRNSRVFLIFLGRGDLAGPSDGIDGIMHLVRERLLPQDQVAILAWNRTTDFTTDHGSALAVLDRFKRQYRKVERALVDFYRSPVYIYGDRQIPAYLQRDIDAVFRGPNGEPMRSANAQLQGSTQAEEALRAQYGLFDAPESDDFSRLQRELIGMDLSTFLTESAKTMQDQANLYAAIEYMRHLEGEKHVVWLTEYGLQRDFSQYSPVELDRDLARKAADARVVLNIIRAGGTQFGPGGQSGAAENSRFRPVVGPSAMLPLLPAAVSRSFAELTGGRSDANRFANASVSADYIDRASRFQYLLGYYPNNTRVDGRFRSVKVTVSRPGVTVLVRGGYYARPETGPLDRRSVVTYSRVAAAASDAREIPDLSLKATARAVTTDGGREVRVDATIDLSRVMFQSAAGRNTASIEVWVFCLDRRQRAVGDLRKTVELSYSDNRLAEARRTGVPVSLSVPVTGAADTLKFVAHDFAGDLTGSLNVRVTP